MIFIGTVLFGVQGGRCAGGRDWTLRKRVGGEYLEGGKQAVGERMARIGGSVNGNPVWFPFLAANRGEVDFEAEVELASGLFPCDFIASQDACRSMSVE